MLTEKSWSRGPKIWVSVRCDCKIGGRVIPLQFQTEDEPAVKIDRVLDIRPAASLRAGGSGIRYTVEVPCGDHSEALYLFRDEDEWFLEAPASRAKRA